MQMPFSKLKIILERITINTWTEIVCYGNLQSHKTGKLSKCIQMLTCLLLTEILLSDDSAYYRQKLVNIGNGVFSQFDTSKSRYKSGNISIREDQVSFFSREATLELALLVR